MKTQFSQDACLPEKTNQMKKNPIESTLKSIDISRLFALRIEHGVSYENSEWKLFEPTTFIYSFFAFNMLYEIDWEESFQRDQIWDYRGRRELYTSDKIKKLLNFIYSKNIPESFCEYYSDYDENFRAIKNSIDITDNKYEDWKINQKDWATDDTYKNNYKSYTITINESFLLNSIQTE